MEKFIDNPNLEKPIYSVIILIYHRSLELVEMARDCVASVKNAGPREEMEIIIVDNGSPRQFPWDEECNTYIRLDKNMGISHGWNVGLKLSRGKYKVIIGDDVIVRKGWLEAMQEAMDMPMAGMANPQVQHLPPGEGIVEDYKWPSGACFMLTQNTINRVGYFDENIYWPANWEDLSYWTRLLRAGLKIYKNHSMTIQHKEGQTVHAPDIASYFEENRKKFIAQHGFDGQEVFMGSKPFPF